MKILFLDIDGVVNSEHTHVALLPDDVFPIDKYMAFLVGKIVIDTGCRIVLSSSWRHSKEGIEQVEKRIHKIKDVTPMSQGGVRGKEIKQWLDTQSVKSDFFVEKYAILDDDPDMLGHQKPNFFQTSWKEGLTEKIALDVINHLNG